MKNGAPNFGCLDMPGFGGALAMPLPIVRVMHPTLMAIVCSGIFAI